MAKKREGDLMERLTIRNSDGTVSQPTRTTVEQVFYLLADYEDTGMTPEQIRNAKETLQCFDNIGIKRGNEIVRAEEEGRLVVLDGPRRPLVWGDDDHDTILCPSCERDLMGGFELDDAGEAEMIQCPHCGQPVDGTKVPEEYGVTDNNVGNTIPVNDLYDEDGWDVGNGGDDHA